jgi:iron only hydrogenase large subunit-like protein
MATLDRLRDPSAPVYAVVAPAFLSQFRDIDDGQLRTIFKRLGFSGMVEVSLFADILTLKEALEFDMMIHDEGDYMLTSCCCPVWIQMIRKLHPELLKKVPGSVSPMVACGRVVKRLVPGAVTVFVGPCLAKKAEAREPDVQDAIDHVLTFKEVADLFEAAQIDPVGIPQDLREHSSFAGRIYAVSKGVSEAVAVTLDRIRPDKPIKVKAVQADGVPECKRLLDELTQGKTTANFLEGMGCAGGCVGGPRSLIDRSVATAKVRDYAKKALYATPIDNPYVIELLQRLGIQTIEELLEDQEVFTRRF